MSSYDQDPGTRFLSDYKERHPSYFENYTDSSVWSPEEERASQRMRDAMTVQGGLPLYGRETMRGPDGSEKERSFGLFSKGYSRSEPATEGMNTSATRDLNSGERGPGGMTREEFESIPEDEKFERLAVPAFRQAAGKPQGFNRVVAGIADFLTGDRYDYDQRGHGNPAIRANMEEGFREKHGRAPTEQEAEELNVMASPVGLGALHSF